MTPRLRHPPRRAPAQIMVLFGLSIVAFVGLVALVLDGGTIYVQRRTAQAAADAAALAGTRELRNATSPAAAGAITTAITTYATANAFGIPPAVTCAYFVGTDGTTDVGAVVAGSGCAGPPVGAIPESASGVHVEVRIPFRTYLAGILGVYDLDADAHATGQVGTLTGFDVRNAPLIVCGGGAGFNGLKLATQTPVVRTATPGVLAATPTALPIVGNNPDLLADILLVTPAAGVTPPSLVANPAKDGTIYYIKGQKVSNSNGSSCGAGGFKGGAATEQPTPNLQDIASGTPAVVVGQTGNRVPEISQRVSTSGACTAGTDPSNDWSEGQPGCVMILPIVDSSSGLTFNVQAWGAFYVWCIRTVGSAGCQEFAGQYLANWPIAGGPAASTWTFGQRGGTTVIRLTS